MISRLGHNVNVVAGVATLPMAMSWILLSVIALVNAQQVLPLNSLSSISAPTSLLALPASPQLTVSVAICASQASSARFFLSNGTSGVIPTAGGGTDVFEIQLNDGNGQWSGPASTGGLLSVQDLNPGPFQVAVSDNGIPEHCLWRSCYQLLR